MASITPVIAHPAPNSNEWFDYDPKYVRLHHSGHLEGRLLIYASLSAETSDMGRDKIGAAGMKEPEVNTTKRLTARINSVCFEAGLNPLVIRACFDEMRSRVIAYYDEKRRNELEEAATVQWSHRLSGPLDLPDNPTMAQLQEKNQETAAQNWWVEMAKLCKTYPDDKDGFKQLARDWNHKNIDSTKARKKKIIETAKAIETGGVKYNVDDITAEVRRLFPDSAWTRDAQFLKDLFPSGTSLPTRPTAQMKPRDGKKVNKNNKSGPVLARSTSDDVDEHPSGKQTAVQGATVAGPSTNGDTLVGDQILAVRDSIEEFLRSAPHHRGSLASSSAGEEAAQDREVDKEYSDFDEEVLALVADDAVSRYEHDQQAMRAGHDEDEEMGDDEDAEEEESDGD